jgi:hypothetical protein
MNTVRHLDRGWLAALALIGLVVVIETGLLAQVAYYQRDDLWPLPGLFFIIAVGAALAGWAGAWLAARDRRRAGAHLLWLSGGTLLGAGLVSLWSVGSLLLPVALLMIAAGTAADWGRWRRLLVHVPALLGLALVAGLGIPMLDQLDTIGAPPMRIAHTAPAPGAEDVPLHTTVVVEVGPLEVERPLTTSMRVVYADAGLLWLRPQPAGRSSGSWGDGGQDAGRFTFTVEDGFEPCRTVGVQVDVSGYAPYAFTFETACSE